MNPRKDFLILKMGLRTLTESDCFSHWGFSSDSSSLLLHPFNILEDISNRWVVNRISIFFFEVVRDFSVCESLLSQLGNYRLQFRMNLKNPFSTFTFSSSVSCYPKNTLVTIYLSFPYPTHFEEWSSQFCLWEFLESVWELYWILYPFWFLWILTEPQGTEVLKISDIRSWYHFLVKLWKKFSLRNSLSSPLEWVFGTDRKRWGCL